MHLLVVTASLLAHAAPALTPVVHDDTSGDDAILAVTTRTGLPATQLVAVSLDDLLEAPPGVRGDAVIRRCTRAPTTSSLMTAEVARAEAAWARDDVIGAMDHLDLAVAHAGCLTELVERGPAAVAFRLRAEVALGQGDRDGARSELRTALAFEPTLGSGGPTPGSSPAWDASDEGRALLDEARAGNTFSVALLPPSAATGPWIDGRTVAGTAALTEGLHLLQYSAPDGIHSAWVVLGGPATLVVPTGYRRPVLERAQDPARRPEVEALLGAAIPDFYAAYVVQSGGVWLVADDGTGTGGLATTAIAEPPPPPPPEPTGKKKRGKKERKKRPS